MKKIYGKDIYRLVHYYSPNELLIHTDNNINFTINDYIS